MSEQIVFRIRAPIGNEELNELFSASWHGHRWRDFRRTLRHSLTHVCAFAGGRLVGFVNLAWDGGVHGFLLDTTVHPAWRRRGVGRRLVAEAAAAAGDHGLQWLHVDYVERYEGFYRACGFRPTSAGLIRLDGP